MAPGESQVIEAFSMTRVEDTSITPTRDNVAVNFFSLTNPNANPTTLKEVRQQAKSGRDFNTQYESKKPILDMLYGE